MATHLLSPRYYRYPAQVLGCLRSGEITVILCAGSGLANGGQAVTLAVELVPLDLRMPNSEFDVLFDRDLSDFTQVLHRDEPHSQGEKRS